MTTPHRRLQDTLSYRVTHGIIVFLFGVIIGVGMFVILLIWLDAKQTDVEIRSTPKAPHLIAQGERCFSLEKIGLRVWVCAREEEERQ